MNTFSGLTIDGFADCHVQGIAIDKERKYMYYSFTTCLIKTDLYGNVVGSVNGIVGHLGCLAYNYDDGRVYGSLEYKNDSIGKGVLNAISSSISFDDRFYIVSFDVDKIVRTDMDAYNDGIMEAVYLTDVVDDYCAYGHRYGCSGIDGITFAPKPGQNDVSSIYVAYGIYSDKKRKDNDNQILLRFEINNLRKYYKPLNQLELHASGPEHADDKFFVYTGNTEYGIQNLEYNKEYNCLFAAVYKGNKFRFPNFSMYAIDIDREAEYNKIKGLNEFGKELQLKKLPFFHKRGKISGCNFPYGSEGMISLGDNKFIFAKTLNDKNGNGCKVFSYILKDKKGFIKEQILL